MRYISRMMVLAAGGALLLSAGAAQQSKPPASPATAAVRSGSANSAAVDAIVARLMAFDRNKDGKLTRDEITDARFLRLFDRADANKDGVVTKEELVALATRMVAAEGSGGRGRGGFGLPDGPRGFGGPPQPGEVLPRPLRDQLQLTDAQKKQLDILQKEVEERLGTILTAEQKKQLQSRRGRFGPRGPAGPDGPPRRRRRGPDEPERQRQR